MNKSTQQSEHKPEQTTHWLPICMCMGLSIGMAIGSLMDNISIGMCMGISLGMAVGSLIDHTQRKSSQTTQQTDDTSHTDTANVTDNANPTE